MTDPIRKSVTVPVPPMEAFDLFTKAIDSWWPKSSHSLSAQTGDGDKARVFIEPFIGGQVIETRADGSTAAWARVTGSKPGAQLNLAWHVGRDEDEATTLEVRFVSHGAGTRVDLTHDGFDNLKDEAQTVQFRYRTGWDTVLGHCYRQFCIALSV